MRAVRAAPLLAALVIWLNACGAQATPLPIQVITLDPSDPVFAGASSTPRPTRTPTPTVTSTSLPEATATPYESIDFAQVTIVFGGFLPGWRYFVAFEFPQTVQGEYYALVDHNKTYKCEVLADYPQRLYCSGPLVVVDGWAPIELYAVGSDVPLLSGRFFVPLLDGTG